MYRNIMYIRMMYSKELVKGTLNAIVLNLLSENGRMYGYEIFSRVKQMTDKKILLKDGSLYPALKKLTALGFLTTEEETVSGRKRKYYKITEEGSLRKSEYLLEIKDFFKTMDKVLSPKTSESWS